jgi:hypothetical protein
VILSDTLQLAMDAGMAEVCLVAWPGMSWAVDEGAPQKPAPVIQVYLITIGYTIP